MEPFSISDVYLGANNMRCININPLPENYCSFDCIFCPLGRTKVKTEESFYFEETKGFLVELEKVIIKKRIEYVFIDPDGEALANSEILDIIRLLKDNNIVVKLLCNGYLVNREGYIDVLNECDEIIGELMVTTEEKFQKILRPLEGYTLEEHVSNMASFNKQYSGKFILDITFLKDISDSDVDIDKFKEYIDIIKPDEFFLETPSGKFEKALGVSEKKINEIRKRLSK